MAQVPSVCFPRQGKRGEGGKKEGAHSGRPLTARHHSSYSIDLSFCQPEVKSLQSSLDQGYDDEPGFWSTPGQGVRSKVTGSATGRRRWSGALDHHPSTQHISEEALKAGGGWETLQVNICSRGTYKLINSFELLVVIAQLCYHILSLPPSTPLFPPYFSFPFIQDSAAWNTLCCLPLPS